MYNAASRNPSLILGGLLVLTAIVYLRCLRNGFVWDDQVLLVNNQLLRHRSFFRQSLSRDEYWFVNPLGGAQVARYRPLLLVWFGLNYQFFGLNPVGWHAVMVAVHLLVVWLAYKVASRLTGEWQTGMLAAFLFALTPLHVEAVVWVGAFSVVPSSAFQLGAFYFFLTRGDGRRRNRTNWAIAMALYACALLVHESSLVFPGLVAAYAFLLGTSAPHGPSQAPMGARSRFLDRVVESLLRAAPFAGEGIIYLMARRLALGFFTTQPGNTATGVQLMLTVPRIVATYLLMSVFPWIAGTAHRLFFVTRATSPQFLLPMGALAAVGAALFLIRNRPRGGLYLFCVAWMVIATVPMLYLRGLGSDLLVADNYAYFSSFGWCVLLAEAASQIARRGVRGRRAVWAGTAAIAVAYVAFGWHLQHFWHDDFHLFTRMIQEFPESPRAHAWLAVEMRQRGDLAGAERELKKSWKLEPDNGATLFELGEVHAQLGRVPEGAAEVAQGIAMRKGRVPAYAYMVLAQLYDLSGNPAQTEAVLKQAESLYEGDKAAGLARAKIRLNHDDAPAAEAILRPLSSRYPDDSRVWVMLGEALAVQRRDAEALAAYRQAIAVASADPAAHLGAAQLLHAAGRDREASVECRRALAAAPTDRNAQALMAQIARGGPPH